MRDLWRLRAQAFAIALVLAAAIATFVLSTGTHRALTQTRDAYYERNQFADVFCEMTRAPRDILDRSRKLQGVRNVDGRIQQFASLTMAGHMRSARALISSVSDNESQGLNRLTIRLGRLPAHNAPNEVVVDEAFAQANGLGIGDDVDAVIYGRRQKLHIIGLGLAPNFIYALGPGDLIPDSSLFGIFWMGRQGLGAVTNRQGAFNFLSARIEAGVWEPEIIRQLDAILQPYGATGCYGRKDQQSHAYLENELTQLRAMAKVIPPVFLLVSAFLVYIVLSRLIETEREQIGLLKAFGYSDWAIAAHYLEFAFAIAAFATMLGVGAGVLMGRATAELYLKFFHFPFLQYRLPMDIFLKASGLAFIAAGLGTVAGVRSISRLQPAIAMLPPPPPIYKPSMVERLGRAAGFSAIGHMIVRHIARWPWRSALTVLGVALALALLFATLQFLDSSRTMIDSHFFRSQRQDLTVSFSEPQRENILAELRSLPGVMRAEVLRGVPVKLSFGRASERVIVESVTPKAKLSARIDNKGHELALPYSGLMLSRQLAAKLGVAAGQRVHLRLLTGQRREVDLHVVRVVDEFVGARAYASETVMAAITHDSTPAGAAHLKIDPAYEAQILRKLNERPQVLGVAKRDTAILKFEEMINDNMVTMLFFYISFASAIAVGVVYNSARILFSERAHELATLRVLGYFQSEVAVILLGEIALLIVISVPLGCALGYVLAKVMVSLFSSDLFRLPFAPESATFARASLVILGATLLTALAVTRHVFKLDMVTVLKAHE